MMSYTYRTLVFWWLCLVTVSLKCDAFSVVSPTGYRTRPIGSRSLVLQAKNGRLGGGQNKMAIVNAERIINAGRKGTKSFVDPNKLFLGNLPFDATDEDVWQFLKQALGQINNVKSVKIIRDWKTGNSKGYGFCIMTNPMFATAAMDLCKGRKIKGRIIRVDQGKKKEDENQVYVKKSKKKAETAEEKAIEAGLEEAWVGEEDEYMEEDSGMEEDVYEDEEDGEYDRAEVAEMLALVEDDTNDQLLFADEGDDDDDFEFDGDFDEEYPEEYDELTEEQQKMNREQRRDSSVRKKRRKLPEKGFGKQP